MANDRETKSYEVRPGGAKGGMTGSKTAGGGGRATRGEAGGTMSGNRDADLRAHGESGSSGVGMKPNPSGTPLGGSIHSRDETGTTGSESGGGSGGLGASGGGKTGGTSGSGSQR